MALARAGDDANRPTVDMSYEVAPTDRRTWVDKEALGRDMILRKGRHGCASSAVVARTQPWLRMGVLVAQRGL